MNDANYKKAKVNLINRIKDSKDKYFGAKSAASSELLIGPKRKQMLKCIEETFLQFSTANYANQVQSAREFANKIEALAQYTETVFEVNFYPLISSIQSTYHTDYSFKGKNNRLTNISNGVKI